MALFRRPYGLVTVVLFVALLCGLVFVGVGVLMAATDETFGYFTRDPASTLGAHPYVGVVTHLTVLLAWGTGVACLVTATHLARVGGWRRAAPLLAAGLGTCYLGLDDLFQFHEDLLPKLRIDQLLVLGTYALATLLYVWVFWDVLRTPEWPFLALAIATLGASVALDQFGGDVIASDLSRYLEEGFKLFGFALLATYLLGLGARLHDAAYPGSADGEVPSDQSSEPPAKAVTTPSPT